MASSGRGILKEYIQDHNEDLYRRGMYTFIKRTVPPPTMIMFDASQRGLCQVKRFSTNTPLQALIMLNDPTILESSRVLAEKLMDDESSIEDKIKKGYQLILCRQASSEEISLMTDYHKKQLERFEANSDQALKFITVGEFPMAESRDSVQLAALMQMVHTLFNLEEAITKS